MTQITDSTTTEIHHVYELSALDRCDSCGAQAYVRATLASGELYFCAHHAAKFREKIAGTAVAWLDETDRLFEAV